jgi:hypothetical protein
MKRGGDENMVKKETKETEERKEKRRQRGLMYRRL